MSLSFLDILSDCHHPFFGGQKGQQGFKICNILCHIVPDLILYVQILRIHWDVQITSIVFSFQSQVVKINKEFLKDKKECYKEKYLKVVLL